MVVRNDLDRYRLVMDVIDRVPGLAVRAAAVRQRMEDVRGRHHAWVREHGTDLPEVADWRWPAETGPAPDRPGYRADRAGPGPRGDGRPGRPPAGASSVSGPVPVS
jgi:hypothetical protein